MTQSEEQAGSPAGKTAERGSASLQGNLENHDLDGSVSNARPNINMPSENAQNGPITGFVGNGPESVTQILSRVTSISSTGDDKSELFSIPGSSAEMFSHSDQQSTIERVVDVVSSSQMAAKTEDGQDELGQVAPCSGAKVGSRKPVVHRRKRRRRTDDSDEEIKADDDSSSDAAEESNDADMNMNMDITPIPTQTKSGRMVTRPVHFVPDADPPRPTGRSKAFPSHASNGQSATKKRHKNGKAPSVVMCTRCQRGHSLSMNILLSCSECSDAWHQFCHDPPVTRSFADRKQRSWFCSSCRPAEDLDRGPVKITLTHKAARGTNNPSVSADRRVGGENFSAAERRSYLSTLSHAALVDLLMDLSDRNPSLPVFPENLRTVMLRNGSKGSTSGASPAPKKRRYNNAMDDSEYGLTNEHRLYPRPGCGFRLPPEVEEDLSILLEDPGCPTFSYKFYRYAAGEESGVADVGAAG